MRILAALSLALLATTATAADLADRVIDAYGGEAAWAKVNVIRQTGIVTSRMQRANGELLRELTRPSKLRVEIRYPSMSEVRIVDGRHGTRDGEEARGPALDAMILQAARIDIPAILIARRSSVSEGAPSRYNDAAVRTLLIDLGDGLSLKLDVDPATFRVVHSTGILPSMQFETEYDDFRKIDGRLFAFHETNIAGSTRTGETFLHNVVVETH